MRRFVFHRWVFLAAIAACAAPVSRAAAEEAPQPLGAPGKPVVGIELTGEVSDFGDIHMRLAVKPPLALWKPLTERYNSAAIMFRDLASFRSTMETEFPAPVKFNEKDLRIEAQIILRGYAENKGEGFWKVDLDMGAGQSLGDYSQTDANGQVQLNWTLKQEDDDAIINGKIAMILPKNAARVQVNQQSGIFGYDLRHPEGQGRPRMKAIVRVKDRVLTGAYKAYGMKEILPQQWLAKAVLKNTGPSVIRHLRVRFMIQGYSEWGLWTKFAEVVRGQTVVVPYHPILDAKVAQLQSATPVNVMVQWRYEDAAGKEFEDSDGVRASLLGGQQYFFSNYRAIERAPTFYESFENSELLAAWVSREDPVVDEFSAMAHRLAGGGPSFMDPNVAVKTLHAIYELWVRNKFVYVSPASLVDRTRSFDPTLLQSVKHPRDVIRDKAGTCIDLAILYCAMAHSQGLEPFLVLVPGHCYPAFLLPAGRGKKPEDRKWFAIEATGITGGMGPGYRSWENVVTVASEDLARVQSGQKPGILVPVKQLWDRGVTGPELPTLPADIIKRWGLSQGTGQILTLKDSNPNGPTRVPNAVDPGPATQPNQIPTPQRVPSASSTLIGRWGGVQRFTVNGIALEAQIIVDIDRNKQTGKLFFASVSRLEQVVNGEQVSLGGAARGGVSVSGKTITFDILESALKNLQTGEIEHNEPSKLVLTLQGNFMSGTDRTQQVPTTTILKRLK